MNHFNYCLADYVILQKGTWMLVLVLPLVDQRLQGEFTMDVRSKNGQYRLVQSLNILLERMNPDIRRQLTLPEANVSLAFLQEFPLAIRRICKL